MGLLLREIELFEDNFSTYSSYSKEILAASQGKGNRTQTKIKDSRSPVIMINMKGHKVEVHTFVWTR